MTALAVSDALLAALKVSSGNRVWVRVPDKTDPPYTVIGQFNSEPIGGKDSGAEWHVVEIIDWTVGATRAPLAIRMAATKLALDKVRISFPGLAPFTPAYMPGTVDDLHDDGLTWSGTQRFKILGQSAD